MATTTSNVRAGDRYPLPAADLLCRQRWLIRRHDFVAEPVGSWAKAALYCDQHREFDGLTFPTRRRVLPRGPGGRVPSRPTLLALDFDDIEIKR